MLETRLINRNPYIKWSDGHFSRATNTIFNTFFLSIVVQIKDVSSVPSAWLSVRRSVCKLVKDWNASWVFPFLRESSNANFLGVHRSFSLCTEYKCQVTWSNTNDYEPLRGLCSLTVNLLTINFDVVREADVTVPVSVFREWRWLNKTSTEEPWGPKKGPETPRWCSPTRGIHSCYWIWEECIWPTWRSM